MRLLVITDDLTGALDTGVQFAKKGISTSIQIRNDTEAGRNEGKGILNDDGETQVVVVDTESRHCAPEKAGKTVGELAGEAGRLKIPYVYKKTDSVLRGNVGAELGALTEKAGKRVCFLPAYPVNGRITAQGVQYLDGVPVADTVFGKDPLNPVTESYIPAIIGRQSSVQVRCFENYEVPAPGCETGIDVFNAKNEEELKRAAETVGKNYTLFAGCAGFADYLDRIIPFKKERAEKGFVCERIIAVSGSLNEITLNQIKSAEGSADFCSRFTDRQLFDSEYCASAEAEVFFERIRDKRFVILYADRGKREGPCEALVPAGARAASVSRNIGKLVKKLVERAPVHTVFVIFGGDTLFEVITALKAVIEPIYEIEPGIVLAKMYIKNEVRYIVTKSGGFGSSDVLVKLKRYLI